MFREIVILYFVKQLEISKIKMETFRFKAVDLHECHRKLNVKEHHKYVD